MKDIFYLFLLPLRTEVVLRFFCDTKYFFFSGFLRRNVLCFIYMKFRDFVIFMYILPFLSSLSIFVNVVHAMH